MKSKNFLNLEVLLILWPPCPVLNRPSWLLPTTSGFSFSSSYLVDHMFPSLELSAECQKQSLDTCAFVTTKQIRIIVTWREMREMNCLQKPFNCSLLQREVCFQIYGDLKGKIRNAYGCGEKQTKRKRKDFDDRLRLINLCKH